MMQMMSDGNGLRLSLLKRQIRIEQQRPCCGGTPGQAVEGERTIQGASR
jgi:hypothetical protein